MIIIADITAIETAKSKDNSINIDKLYIGQTVKNYAEMCKLLDDKVTNGKSKTYQLKNWKRYFDYEKAGQSFTITEIYDEPLPKDDKRARGNKSIYVKYIEYLLMYHFANTDGNTEVFYKVQLYKLLGMVNNSYSEFSRKTLNSNITDKLTYATKYDITDFYKRVPPKLERILFTALNNLKRRCLLDYFELYFITCITDNGNSITRIATDDEVELILKIKHKALEKMGFKDLWQVYYNEKSEEFYSLVEEIQSEKYGWTKVSKQFKIIYSKENMKKDLPQTESEIQRLLLNTAVYTSINSQAKKRFDKFVEDKEMFTIMYSPPETEAEKEFLESYLDNKLFTQTYMSAQKELADYLIKLQI